MQTSARAAVAEESMLVAKAGELRVEIAGHKRAIRKHREGLAAAKEALVELEARCRQLGIRVVVQE